MTHRDRVLFDGLAEMLTRPDGDKCPQCRRRPAYGAEEIGTFGRVEFCQSCRSIWQNYIQSFPDRAGSFLPRLHLNS
ncbi:hypothetical protein [Actinomadura macra]|uniref:hypothetical protein n=1 Tax=Actinomadura macra TaxID=46164 RepID=UPI000832F037|nr:hypothetical protein [Actinomadura macra]